MVRDLRHGNVIGAAMHAQEAAMLDNERRVRLACFPQRCFVVALPRSPFICRHCARISGTVALSAV